MDDVDKWLSLLGAAVLAIPVWKANQTARQLSRVDAAEPHPADNVVFKRLPEKLKKRLEPGVWTRADECILFVGYALAFLGQGWFLLQ